MTTFTARKRNRLGLKLAIAAGIGIGIFAVLAARGDGAAGVPPADDPIRPNPTAGKMPAAPSATALPPLAECDYGKLQGKLDEKAVQNFRKGFAIETFAVASALDLTGKVDIGGGLGATYFFTRGFGAGVRALAWNTTNHVVDEIDARLIARAPLWDRVAPYGYVEGTYNTLGVDFDDGAWGAGAGGGLDFALFPNVHLFGEAGLGVDTEGNGSFRGSAGIKLPF